MDKAESIDWVIDELQRMIDVQCTPGTVEYDEYQLGMANGMIFAMSILTGEEPNFVTAPEVWRKELEILDNFNTSGAVIPYDETT